jgi:hypothetical protein
MLILLETRLKPTDDVLRLKVKEEYIQLYKGCQNKKVDKWLFK